MIDSLYIRGSILIQEDDPTIGGVDAIAPCWGDGQESDLGL